MKASLLRLIAVSGALAFLAAIPNAHAQSVSLSAGLLPGGAMSAGQMRSWAFNVPEGNYLALGRVSYNLRSNQDSAGLSCQLKRINTDEFWDYEEVSITGDAGGGPTVEGEITLMAQVPIPAQGSLVVQCRAEGGQTGVQTVQLVRLELIQVSSFGTLTAMDTSGVAAPVANRRAVVPARRN